MTSPLKPIPSLHQEFSRDKHLARVRDAVSLSQPKLAELPGDVLRERNILVPVELQKIAPFLVSEIPLSDHVEPSSVEPLNDSTLLRFDGVEQPIIEWALDYGITPAIIIGRLERGMTIADAITMPMKTCFRGQRLPQPPARPHPRRDIKRPQLMLSLNGHTHPLDTWAQITGLNARTIKSRLRYGWSVERTLTEAAGAAMGRPQINRPGVSSNFPPFEGTGAGSTLQETPKITFSEKA